MTKIKAFRGIRPRKEAAKRVAALPYDVYSRREAKLEVEREPLSFLKIDRPETQFGDSMDMYAPEVYQKAHDLLWEAVSQGLLVKDETPCCYVYELTMNGRTQTGLVACAAVDDYLSGVIMKHENTREEKEQDRICHVDVCDAQTGPIFLAYRRDELIRDCMEAAKRQEAIFDFTAPDGVRHRGWMIQAPEIIGKIQEQFGEISHIYIADGHHRAASAVKVSLKRRAQEKEVVGSNEHEYDYFLSVLFAEDELYIMDYNRVVEDLGGHTPQEFLRRIESVCEVTESELPFYPGRKGELGMFLDGKWYQLIFKEEYCSQDPVEGLDVSILQCQILSPVLGIEDPKTDGRISFVGGIRGLDELQRSVEEKGGVAFSMYPTSMEELFAVADAGKLMPPKSTWFEPKLRSGLFIHPLR